MRRRYAVGSVIMFLLLTAFVLLASHQHPDATISGHIGNDAVVESGTVHVEPPDPAIEPQEEFGLLEGTIVADVDSPVKGIEVELISADKSGDKVSQASVRDWTDAAGKYKFDRVETGEYLVAVLKRGAPDGRHPFAGSYYPGTEDEAQAVRY